jgi:hypothetical protein
MAVYPVDREQQPFAAHLHPHIVDSHPEVVPPYTPYGDPPRSFVEGRVYD